MTDTRLVVVIRSRMIHGSIIKDRQVIHTPLDPTLQIMIVGDQIHKEVLDPLALRRRQPIHLLQVMPHPKHRFPPRDRVRPHHGMHRRQALVDVPGTAARDLVQMRGGGVGLVAHGREAARQRLQPRAERGRQPVVDFVGAGEDGVAAGGGAGTADQGGVVRCLSTEK